MIKREYKKVKVSSLIPYEKNNKIHTDKNIDEIVKSIQANTYVSPIVCDEDMVIIAWHGRKLALDKLWTKEADVLIVSWLSQKQKRDLRLRDNKLTELSDWDFENIQFEIDEIDDPELSDLFDVNDIDFDNIKSNEDREAPKKIQNVTCPQCDHRFTI